MGANGRRKRGMMVKPQQQQSQMPSQRSLLPEITWDQIHEPGAYVELGSGDLFRVNKEAIGPASPIITRESNGATRLLQVSRNPYVTSEEARLKAAQHNVQPNF